MIEYKVVRSQDIKVLEKEVSSLLNSGWKCQGGFSIQSSIQGPSLIFQAMTKQ